MPDVIHEAGTLIHARGREWVVLPNSSEELLLARPVGGLDEEITGIMPSVELVSSATFPLPKREDLGDSTSCRLLRDSARISTRAAAGPFRSFARIAVEPRPYQLVPLMMALKQDPVRLLIADDVGIGKTIEAALIARELLDRGEIKNMAVLCPPQLAEQWQKALREQFHIEAELILSSTIQRLERNLPVGVSVFDRHPFTVVSLDFIKAERHAHDFVLKCPEFVIVDEAHSCTLAGGVGRGYQQRFHLLQQIAEKPDRHLVLVTATPHNGNEQAFRSMLSLLDSEFADLPTEIAREEREGVIRKLAKHLVQRRRSDIVSFDQGLHSETNFPDRKDKEVHYSFSPRYRELFDDIVDFARAYVGVEGEGDRRRQRVRYWSALALLRCVSSSPAAAIATLRSRATADEATADQVDEIGRRTVLDQGEEDDASTIDLNPGSQQDGDAASDHDKLLEFAARAEALSGDDDAKLSGAITQLRGLLRDGYRPIVFCRFVETAEYLTKHLREKLRNVRVESVTGKLPPTAREERIHNLVKDEGSYVLVCTDCLSEGVNLQHDFNAVVHYDLAWTPTRHEQREGRVDRYGQSSAEVRVITYFGKDNPIDGIILDILIRKHKAIKNDLKVTVAVPTSGDEIAQALFEGALFRKRASGREEAPTLFADDEMERMRRDTHQPWDEAAQREKKSRSRFVQHQLDKDAVAHELAAVRRAIGSFEDVGRFVRTALRAARMGVVEEGKTIDVHVDTATPRGLRQAIGTDEPFKGRFDFPLGDHELYLGRTSPIVEGLAGWVMDQALDAAARDDRAVAARCGVMFTKAVDQRTTLVLARFRYHLKEQDRDAAVLCEEILPLAFTGTASEPVWLEDDAAEALLTATPSQNIGQSALDQQLERLLPSLPSVRDALGKVAPARASAQLEIHKRVRAATKTSQRLTVQPVLPVDILGAYVLLAPIAL